MAAWLSALPVVGQARAAVWSLGAAIPAEWAWAASGAGYAEVRQVVPVQPPPSAVAASSVEPPALPPHCVADGVFRRCTVVLPLRLAPCRDRVCAGPIPGHCARAPSAA